MTNEISNKPKDKKPRRNKKPKEPVKQADTPEINSHDPYKNKKPETYAYFHADYSGNSGQLKVSFEMLPEINFEGKRKNSEYYDKLNANKIEIIANLPTFDDNGILFMNVCYGDKKASYLLSEDYTSVKKIKRHFEKANDIVRKAYYGRWSNRAVFKGVTEIKENEK